MDEELFVKLLDLRKYLHSQADKLIDAGFDVNSEVIDKFFTASSEIITHIEKIMGIKPYWKNETTLSWALYEALDDGRKFEWSIDGVEYAGENYDDLWYALDCEVKGILPDKLQVKENG